MQEGAEIRLKYPNKIPVILGPFPLHPPKAEGAIAEGIGAPFCTPLAAGVPVPLPLSQFVVTLRTRLSLASSQTFYLLVNNKGLPNPSITMQELYRDNRDEDGFLYLTYASQERFGSSSCIHPWTKPVSLGMLLLGPC